MASMGAFLRAHTVRPYGWVQAGDTDGSVPSLLFFQIDRIQGVFLYVCEEIPQIKLAQVNLNLSLVLFPRPCDTEVDLFCSGQQRKLLNQRPKILKLRGIRISSANRASAIADIICNPIIILDTLCGGFHGILDVVPCSAGKSAFVT